MGEAAFMACLGDNVTSEVINLAGGGSCFHVGDGGFLSLADDLIDFLHERVRFAEANGASHIRGIALIDDAEVE